MNKIFDDQIFKTSQYINQIKISNNRFAVWNRYKPTILFLNEDSIKLLEILKENTEPYKEFKGFKRILKKFIKNNLIYSEKDDCKHKYIEAGDKNLKRIFDDFETNISDRLQYNEFVVISNKCNLQCSYCVCEFIRKDYLDNATHKSKDKKIDRLLNCIDKNLNSDTGNRKLRRAINFNGGEILLHKDIVTRVVEHINTNHSKKEISFNINTNGTLIDDITAKFLTNHFNTIALSIDGHKEAHNQTRIYTKNKKGSFNDVIDALYLIT